MAETPQIITRTRRSDSAQPRAFSFSVEQVRTTGMSAGLRALREQAWQVYESTPMPGLKDEAWRRTDLRALQSPNFHLPAKDAYLDLAPLPENLLRPVADEEHAGQLVLLPGGSRGSLADDLAAQGVIFTDLRSAEQKHPEILEKIAGKIIQPKEGKFAALATALAQDGVLLYVPKNVQVTRPLHSLMWGPGANLAHVSHVLVLLEEGASVTYVHESASPSEDAGQIMHAGLVEIHVGQGANLRFVELQSWGENVWNFSHERARVEQDGNLDWIFGAIGSRVTKNFSDLDLAGTGSVGKMSGFYFTDHEQHLDHDTQQNHLAPHTTSDLLFKGALLGKSRSVWQGMIYVAPGAFKTDGYQANRNLVLSREARADSIPGLEILADDVRCTHGATVGKIDEDLIFYLESRGIPRFDAESLIVEGFFDTIMERIPFEGVRTRFQEAIHNKMNSYRA